MTLLDGIIVWFSPTATGHSVNYRSVVVMGKAEVIEGHDAKLAAMRDFVEYVLKGRWADVRPPTEQELKGTMVVAVPLSGSVVRESAHGICGQRCRGI